MIKSFLISTTISITLVASQQIVLVVSDDFNTSSAQLQCFEDGKRVFEPIEVNLGKNGLGWGLGEEQLAQKDDEPLKHEGDKKSPAGVFQLTSVFGYAPTIPNRAMPYLYATKELICVDDANSPFYNQIIMAQGDEKSFEKMKRDDKQYQLGIVVAHNKKAKPKRGSCIFLHVEKSKKAKTLGCTSMSYKHLDRIVRWLDKQKNPLLIQVTKNSLKEIVKKYRLKKREKK